jgi:hypothetical protein
MSSRSRLREVLCAALIIVATLPRGAHAQDTGIVTGAVVDGTGQVLPGATVTLLNEATASARTLTTNERGEFTFRAVQPGTYTIAAEVQGFRKYERRNNVMNASSQLALGALVLEIGSLAEVVTVAAQGTTVETRNSDYSGLLTSSRSRRFKPRGATSSTCCACCRVSITRTTSTPWGTASDRRSRTSPVSGGPGTR